MRYTPTPSCTLKSLKNFKVISDNKYIQTIHFCSPRRYCRAFLRVLRGFVVNLVGNPGKLFPGNHLIAII